MRVMFLGSKRVGLRCLEAMLQVDASSIVAAVTLDDGADVRSVRKEFWKLSANRSVLLHAVSRRADVKPLIERHRPDLCIVVGWYWLISDALIAAVRNGFIGIHFSLLPRYRGSSPLVWTMLNGETETGVSMFTLVKDVDAGDIWGQRRVVIEKDEYIGTVLAKLEDRAVDLIKTVFPALLAGTATATPQDHSRATFCSPRTPGDGVIDWHSDSETVLRVIRSQSRPYPGAFTTVNERRLTIWRASRGYTASMSPGTVARQRGVAAVVCGDNKSILADEVECDGVNGSLDQVLDPSIMRLG